MGKSITWPVIDFFHTSLTLGDLHIYKTSILNLSWIYKLTVVLLTLRDISAQYRSQSQTELNSGFSGDSWMLFKSVTQILSLGFKLLTQLI